MEMELGKEDGTSPGSEWWRVPLLVLQGEG